MFLTTTDHTALGHCLDMQISRKRTVPSNKNHPTKKQRRVTLFENEPLVEPSSSSSSEHYTAWLQLLQLSSSITTAEHYSNSRKRQKKDITWPSLQSIAQLQGHDNWCWSQTDKSHATEIRTIGKEFQSVKFHPFWSNFGTAGIRATKPLNGGIHYWQILLPGRVFGTSMMIGIGTQKARVHADGFVHLLGGLDDESWGLCHNGQLWHGGRYIRFTSPFPANEPTAIGVLFDGINGTLTFYRNGKCLGVAFSDIPSTSHAQDPNQPRYFYPMLSSTSAQTEMVLCCQLRNFSSLQDRCRSVIAKSVAYSNEAIDSLPLPDKLKLFLSYEVLSHPVTVK